MKRETNQRSALPKNLSEQDNIQKILGLTAGIGGAFGFLVTVFIFSMRGFQKPDFLYILAITPFCTLIAAFAGLFNVFLNHFLIKLGFANSKKTQFVVVALTILLAMTLGLLIAANFGLFNTKEQLPFIMATSAMGFIFGMIVTIVDERLWNMRHKILTLELENKYLTELAKKDHLLQETAKNLIIAAERNRMARELHDSVSQGIHGIIYTAHSLKQHLQPEDQKNGKILEHLITTADATLNELRTMIIELKPSLLEERGLAEAIKLHCQLVAERLKIKCTFNPDQINGATPQQEIAVYRIVQEALANIQQHAGANEVTIDLFQEGDYLKLIITDNGGGFDMKRIKHGNGLHNIESRCLENAGNLKIESIPSRGTKIEAIFQIK